MSSKNFKITAFENLFSTFCRVSATVQKQRHGTLFVRFRKDSSNYFTSSMAFKAWMHDPRIKIDIL